MVKDVHVYFRHFISHLLFKDRVCCLQLDKSVNITHMNEYYKRARNNMMVEAAMNLHLT